MSNEARVNRRRFLGMAAAGAAGVAALGSLAPRARSSASKGVGERLVPPGKLGIQQWSIRDSITRRSIASSQAAGLSPTMGYLGGADFPDDPTDLGPLVPLPGGFVEVFEYLASLGYRGFEFFQFTQNVNELGRQPTIQEIRQYLDNAGLVGQGTHTAALGTMYSAATGGISAAGQTQINNALVLGLPMIGTAGDPTSSNLLVNPNPIGWAEAARRANIVGEACRAAGLKWYWHPEQNAYQGFNLTVHPELARTNRLEWFYANTDPELVFVEPDTFHGYAGRARFPFPGFSLADRYNPEFLFDLPGWWKANWQRLVAWHVKDGTRLASNPNPPTNPFTQTIARPGFPLSAMDVIYLGEGSIGAGYPIDPDPAMIGFERMFADVGAKGSRFYMTEGDSTQGGGADPGRSLRHAKLAAHYLLGVRNGPKPKRTSSAEDEASFESELQEVSG